MLGGAWKPADGAQALRVWPTMSGVPCLRGDRRREREVKIEELAKRLSSLRKT